MKKILISLFTLLLSFTLVTPFSILANEEEPTQVGLSRYYEDSLVEHNDLKAGVYHDKYIGYSSSGLTGFNAAGSGGGGLNVADQYYPQSVNIMNIPMNGNSKIVNWVYQSSYGWARGTVESIAENFELHNPGWRVIAAINGDFFDISKTKPLPETTSGYCVIDGKVIKSNDASGSQVGFTNNPNLDTMIGGELFEVTDYYTLYLYDESGKQVNSYKIDNVNPSSIQSGLSLYYTYPTDPDDNIITPVEEVNSVLPVGGLLVKLPERCIPINQNGFYGQALLANSGLVEEETIINKEKFGIYTDNETIKQDILNSSQIIVQKNVVGAYADCTSVTGCGVQLVNNGEGVVLNDKNRHPRTMVGQKADGTIVFATVDGRQPADNMYGMTYDEQAAMMLHYGCVEAYNLDGGGSTTILIREGDEFRVLNSPSDGSARLDANALLVVVPEISLEITDVLDSTLTVKKPATSPDIAISNIVVNINNKNYNLDGDSLVIEGLNPTTEYDFNYSYNRTMNGVTTLVNGDTIKVKTGNTLPTIEKFNYKYENNTLTVEYEINDPTNIITFATLNIGRKTNIIDLSNPQVVFNNVTEFDPETLVITLVVDLNSSTDTSLKISFDGAQPIVEDVPVQDDNNGGGCGNSGYVLISFMALLSLSYIVFKKK